MPGVTESCGGEGDTVATGTVQDEKPVPATDSNKELYYEEGHLVSGSLEALVDHMVPDKQHFPDRAFLFAFLLASRLFIRPHELLGQVLALCDTQKRAHQKQIPAKEHLARIMPYLVKLLSEWTDMFPYDFRDDKMMTHVRGIAQKCESTLELSDEVSTLLQTLLNRLTALENFEDFLQSLSSIGDLSSIETLQTTDITEVCNSELIVAQQLTHIELERLSYIGPEEFVQSFAKENPQLEPASKDIKKTRNLESYIGWFNRLSFFVATEICKQDKRSNRVKIIEFWIETARECFNIGNFNSLMAIMTGLSMVPVTRLKKTWSKLETGKLSALQYQMDPSSNFSNYRATLKAAVWRSASGTIDQSLKIIIPFFSLLLKDTYEITENCANKLPNGHINFEHFWQLAKQVTDFITWKQVDCPFDKIPKVISFLQSSPVFSENNLALASYECEVPSTNQEKDHYTSLKKK